MLGIQRAELCIRKRRKTRARATGYCAGGGASILTLHAEPLEHPRRLTPVGANLAHDGGGRTLTEPGLQRVKRGGRPFGDDADGAVALVPHPAR